MNTTDNDVKVFHTTEEIVRDVLSRPDAHTLSNITFDDIIRYWNSDDDDLDSILNERN